MIDLLDNWSVWLRLSWLFRLGSKSRMDVAYFEKPAVLLRFSEGRFLGLPAQRNLVDEFERMDRSLHLFCLIRSFPTLAFIQHQDGRNYKNP